MLQAHLITIVPGRPGHALRYALDSTKLRRELGLGPSTSFKQGLAATIAVQFAQA